MDGPARLCEVILLSFRPALHVSCFLFGGAAVHPVGYRHGVLRLQSATYGFCVSRICRGSIRAAATTEVTNAQALKQTGAELEAVGNGPAGGACFWHPGGGDRFMVVVLLRPGCSGALPMAAGIGYSGECPAVCVFDRRRRRIPPVRALRHSNRPHRQLGLLYAGPNPFLFATEALRVAWVSKGSMAQRGNSELMPYDVAVRTAQDCWDQATGLWIHGILWSEP